MTRRSIVLVVLALCLFFAAAPASAQQSPVEFVQQLTSRAIAMLKDTEQGDPAVREQKFREIVNNSVDMAAIGQFVLGAYWRNASEQQRQKYLATFGEFMIRSYMKQLGDYGGEAVRVARARQEGDRIIVDGAVVYPGGDRPAPIAFQLERRGDTYRVTDLKIEGVSLALTQRSDFASFLGQNNGDIDALIAVLQRKIAAR